MREPMIKTGDTFKCSDADDLVETMTELASKNIKTDFFYELDGEKGFFLIVTKGEDHVSS